jgi:hypothetical protein
MATGDWGEDLGGWVTAVDTRIRRSLAHCTVMGRPAMVTRPGWQ